MGLLGICRLFHFRHTRRMRDFILQRIAFLRHKRKSYRLQMKTNSENEIITHKGKQKRNGNDRCKSFFFATKQSLLPRSTNTIGLTDCRLLCMSNIDWSVQKKTFILFKQTHKARPGLGLGLGKTYFHLVFSKHTYFSYPPLLIPPYSTSPARQTLWTSSSGYALEEILANKITFSSPYLLETL